METATTQISIVEMLSAAILALTRGDVTQLEWLAVAAPGVRRSETTVDEQRIAQEKLRTLGALIALTRRNLRLLHACGYRT